MASKAKLLIIDDKVNLLKMLKRLFEDRYDVTTCSSGKRGLELCRWNTYDIVLTDIRMPDANGMSILEETKRGHPDTEVVIMTAYAEVQQAVEAMKQGAYDYIRKPFEPDELIITIEKAVERKRLKEQASFFKEELERRYGFSNIVGQSPAMQRVFELATKAARTDTTVLLTGESGTGKEVFARAIHYASRRAEKRFVAINCGAMPKELIESELFGHVRGAFSGATNNKAGLFEEADGGTLFLDEITELNPDLQVKINRAIQEKEIRRVGDTRDRKVDARIIAATNQNLKEALSRGEFREDLYYRLNVFPIHLPPLREREGDIPLLVNHFMKEITGEKSQSFTIEPDAMRIMLSYSWPGNVRQLRNVIERAVVLSENGKITANHFDFAERKPGISRDSIFVEIADLPYKRAMAKITTHSQKIYIRHLLKLYGGNVTKAAQHAGIERESFHRLMRKLGIRKDEVESD